MNTIPVCSIERLRMNLDGPGVRTLVIVSGCPLRCRYCINKSTWDEKGKWEEYSQERLYQAIRTDELYYRTTGGGITFGGGEPLLCAAFIRSFYQRFCENWGICIQSSLNVPEDNVALVADIAEHIFVDIKTLDRKRYKKYTGSEPDQAYDNLQYLISTLSPDKYTVRIPVIKGMKSERTAEAERQKLLKMGVKNTDLFNYVIR